MKTSLRVLLLAATTVLAPTLHASQVIEWGDSTQGGVGPGSTNPPPDLTNAVALAAGFYHSLALTADGRVVAWGANDSSQTNVPAGLSNVVGIAAGPNHSVALKADGTLIAWGQNGSGQTNVPGNLTNAVQVVAGQDFTLALLSDGTITAWGQFFGGASGFPIFVPSTATNCLRVAAGAGHALAITQSGGVIAWSAAGQSSSAVTNVPMGLSNVVSITAGRDENMALLANGKLKLWGSADVRWTNYASTLSNIVMVSAERLWGMTLDENGKIDAWGSVVGGDYGQTNVPPGLTASFIAAGRYHGLALVDPSQSLKWSLLPPTVQSNYFDLVVPTIRGRLYVVESASTASPAEWIVERRIAGDGNLYRYSTPAVATRFFRVRQTP